MSWKVTNNERSQDQLLVNESLFALGNGFLGVRGNVEEGYGEGMISIRGTYINAYHDETPIEYGEKLHAFPETQQKLVNGIDAQTIYISVNGERFSMSAGTIHSFERTLHMDKGQLIRNVDWESPSGIRMKLMFSRFVSMTTKELFMQQVEIEPEEEADIVITAEVNGSVTNFSDPGDPRVASGHAERLHVTDCRAEGRSLLVTDETYETKLEMHVHSMSEVSAPADRTTEIKDGRAAEHYSLKTGERIVFTRWNVFTDTYRHGESLQERAENIIRKCGSFDEEAAKQQAYLTRFWEEAGLKIEGDDSLQQGLRFHLYHLLQSAGKDGVSNIPAKGLSGEGYEGHYFWDTEIYMLPFFQMTQPEIALQLIKYRYSLLGAAKDRAREVGHEKGALFPWRTITGGECSAFFPAGTAQYHISADIAYSFIQYYLVTGDISFVDEYMLEVLTEVSRLWMDMGHYKGGTFRIDDVTGPDEYTCIVNNNYYTNVMARHSLQWAVKSWELIGGDAATAWKEKLQLEEGELAAWQEAADRMYLPYNEEHGIHAQDDTFLQKKVWDLENTPDEKFPLLLNYHPLTLYRYQVCKQADTVLGHFLLEEGVDEEVMRRSYDYYEKVTTHDSSLSYCIFSMMAARLGDTEKAYDYFIKTARLDIDNTHKNTKDGLHLANMGGTWLALVYGFAGLRVDENGLRFRPVLPKAWESMAFRIRYQGRFLEVELGQDQITYRLLDGEDLSIDHFETSVTVQAGKEVHASYQT
ncbi:glycoside hydrolase family 65 protein [Alkalicoccus urumqiensis]|uniref:Family 65 glycosyl hydrolase n=1 Tax=Alkalicoccus urumqiensis TaxID=1548213 RepID=A0A2P6MGE6_ALKUR|nr:glycosyl hydrolase family 65 protein [Alkalicoccus urumqiensis]PRO65341.1 family 65 glycosyl hydrolase [Alkalicoccus urumqiensis]